MTTNNTNNEYQNGILYNVYYENYGNCVKISRYLLQSFIISIGIIIPVIIPLPLCLFLSRHIRNDIKFRY